MRTLKGSLPGSMAASWCHVWTPAPPRTETPCRRIQNRVPIPTFTPGFLFPVEGSCRGRPRNTSVFPASPGVVTSWCQCSGFQPHKVCCFFCYVALGQGESVPDLSGRLTASGSEPQQNCAQCWSDRGHHTFTTLPPERSAAEKFLHETAVSEITSPFPTLCECLAQPQYWGAVFNACCKSTALLGFCAENLQCSPFLRLTAMD